MRERFQRLNQDILEDLGLSGINYKSGTDEFIDNQVLCSDGINTELGITAEEFPWMVIPVDKMLVSP